MLNLGRKRTGGDDVSAPVPPPASAGKVRRDPATVKPPAAGISPAGLSRRGGGWPVEWRERWGRRANALEEKGLSWRDAETQAFVEVWKERRRAEHSADAV